jgi:hypothetical protein
MIRNCIEAADLWLKTADNFFKKNTQYFIRPQNNYFLSPAEQPALFEEGP